MWDAIGELVLRPLAPSLKRAAPGGGLIVVRASHGGVTLRWSCGRRPQVDTTVDLCGGALDGAAPKFFAPADVVRWAQSKTRGVDMDGDAIAELTVGGVGIRPVTPPAGSSAMAEMSPFTATGDVDRGVLDALAGAASIDGFLPNLGGVHIRAGSGGAAVGEVTNTYCMLRLELPGCWPLTDGGPFTVSRDAVTDIIPPRGGAVATVGRNDVAGMAGVVWEWPGVRAVSTSRALEGGFPDFDSLIPEADAMPDVALSGPCGPVLAAAKKMGRGRQMRFEAAADTLRIVSVEGGDVVGWWSSEPGAYSMGAELANHDFRVAPKNVRTVIPPDGEFELSITSDRRALIRTSAMRWPADIAAMKLMR